jgi:hypothetical protein
VNEAAGTLAGILLGLWRRRQSSTSDAYSVARLLHSGSGAILRSTTRYSDRFTYLLTEGNEGADARKSDRRR